ncbi:MAG: hypothetical protein LUH05_07780, partial [Candidatus Gastranaerophilales bacterium]|nr:hypothetical protein [Candidatus Gastranaerophilales bacterium]
ACAVYYYDDGNNDDNPNVDKFVPTSGVKIKESGLARMMENATRDAMDSSKGNKKSSVQKKTQQTQQENSNSYQRSYKWF